MALVLKKLTLEGGAGRKGNEEDADIERSIRQMYDTDWTRFCGGTLRIFETKWTKKLEEYVPEDHLPEQQEQDEEEHEPAAEPPSQSRSFGGPSSKLSKRNQRSSRYEVSEEDNAEDQENQIEQMLQTGTFQRTLLAKRNKVSTRPSREELDKAAADEEEEAQKEKNEESTFFDNQFWKAPSLVKEDDLDALLKEQGFEF